MPKTKNAVTYLLALLALWTAVTNQSAASEQLENLLESHARGGWPNFFSKIERGEDITIAYIGGSITAQPGWRPETLEYFRRKYPNINFREINAAITGTNSTLGVARIQRDIHSSDRSL
jgi:hypothetical protein